MTIITNAARPVNRILFTSSKVEQNGCFGLGLMAALADADTVAEAAAEMAYGVDADPTDAEWDAMAEESALADMADRGCFVQPAPVAVDFAELAIDINMRVWNLFNRPNTTDPAKLAAYEIARATEETRLRDGRSPKPVAPIVKPARRKHRTAAEWATYRTPAWTPTRKATLADMADRHLGIGRRLAVA